MYILEYIYKYLIFPMYAFYSQNNDTKPIHNNEIIKEKKITDYVDNKKIYFAESFNMDIDFLPNNVEWIIFVNECVFTCSLNYLTENIKGIVFTDYSACETTIDNLPSSLIYLIFDSSCEFNNSVDSLPQNLQYFELESLNFNQPIRNLPMNLISLKLGKKISQPIDKLPASLIYLEIKNSETNLNNLPQNIKFLNIVYSNHEKMKSFEYPPKLKRLTIMDYRLFKKQQKKKNTNVGNNKDANTNANANADTNAVHIDFLPSSLKYLEINSVDYKYSISSIPKLMRQIKFIGPNSFDYSSCDFSDRKCILTSIPNTSDPSSSDNYDFTVDFYK